MKKHGGTRPGAGRPSTGNAKQTISIRLDENTINTLDSLTGPRAANIQEAIYLLADKRNPVRRPSKKAAPKRKKKSNP